MGRRYGARGARSRAGARHEVLLCAARCLSHLESGGSALGDQHLSEEGAVVVGWEVLLDQWVEVVDALNDRQLRGNARWRRCRNRSRPHSFITLIRRMTLTESQSSTLDVTTHAHDPAHPLQLPEEWLDVVLTPLVRVEQQRGALGKRTVDEGDDSIDRGVALAHRVAPPNM